MAPARAREKERSGRASVWLVLGLANPGSEFEGTRHNVGGDAVHCVARHFDRSLTLERGQRARTATIDTPGGAVTLAVPTTFMNESGAALPGLLRRTSLEDIGHLLVVHDELDLEPGRLQLKHSGGLAGHNGLRSVADVLKSREFARLRIGVGKPPHRDHGANYVLTRPRGEQAAVLSTAIEAAADVIGWVIEDGFDAAQRRVNGS